MAHSLYIASMEPRSGESLVSLGVMDFASRRVARVGFFRPLVHTEQGRDNAIELIRGRYCPDVPYESMYGLSYEDVDELVADDTGEALLRSVFESYKEIEQECDFVLCQGTDYTGWTSAFEFDVNAQIANHLGCPVLLVVNGQRKSTDQMVSLAAAARAAFEEQHCTIAATVVNRIAPERFETVASDLEKEWPYGEPVYVLQEDEVLDRPTVEQIARALDARPLFADTEGGDREVSNCKVAAMQLRNFLHYVEEGSLIITPGDRADVILGCLGALSSDNFPNLAGILLTGGLDPEPTMTRLLEGLRRVTLPIYVVDTDTYTTALRVSEIEGVIDPQNERKIATALRVFESGVNSLELERRVVGTRSRRVTPIMFEYAIVQRAKTDKQHIVLPEGTEERILRAAEILLRRGVVDITLLGRDDEIREEIAALGLNMPEVRTIDPEISELRPLYAHTYREVRKHKGVSESFARDLMRNVSYFGTMMVHHGDADGMVSGSIHTTAHTIRPAFEIIRARPDTSIVSSVFFMCLEDRVLVYGDCAVNPNPDASQLADIAISSADTAQQFGVEPMVAMLSYSTGTSGKGQDVDKVREATRLARERRPELKIEGPMQYDAAADAGVARTKMPESEVAGHATVFIFPDLNTGNNTYKAVQRSAGAIAVGPVMQGLNKPVNDLSRGCTVPDIVNTVAITAIQAQSVEA